MESEFDGDKTGVRNYGCLSWGCSSGDEEKRMDYKEALEFKIGKTSQLTRKDERKGQREGGM